MSTRSSIGIRYADGTVKAIYCHWDGYIENNGKILFENYNVPEKVEELLKLGDISSLRKFLVPDPDLKHTFDCPQPDVTVAYHRDRGEDFRQPDEYQSAKEFAEKNPKDSCTEFLYLFDTAWGAWMVFDVYGKKMWEELANYFPTNKYAVTRVSMGDCTWWIKPHPVDKNIGQNEVSGLAMGVSVKIFDTLEEANAFYAQNTKGAK